MRSPGRLLGEIPHCLKYLKDIRKTHSCSRFGAAAAPKSEPLVSKSRAHDGSGQAGQKILEEGRQRTRTAKIEQVESTCLSEL